MMQDFLKFVLQS